VSLRLREDVRKAVLMSAAFEADRRGARRIGTEDLLLGVLHDRTSQADEVLGVDLDAARATVDDLDRSALASVGVDLGGMTLRPRAERSRRRPPLTSGAKAVLVRAVRLARAERARRVGMRHLLVALLGCRHPDPAAELLDALEVDRAEALRRAERMLG
jgi:ATP-dependent Clp protease ATP-binding subunit ClpA